MGALQEFERELERGPIEAPLSSRQSRRGSSNFRALMSAEMRRSGSSPSSRRSFNGAAL